MDNFPRVRRKLTTAVPVASLRFFDFAAKRRYAPRGIAVLAVALIAVACSCDGSGSASGSLAPGVQTTIETTPPPTNADEPSSNLVSVSTTAVTTAPPSSTTLGSDTANDPGDEPKRDCSPRPLTDFSLLGSRAASLSLQISRAMFDCADEVALAPQGDSAAIATLISAGVRGPLLLADYWRSSPVLTELRRLTPDRVVTAGVDPQIIADHLSGLNVEVIAVDPQATLTASQPAGDKVWLVDEQGHVPALTALGRQVGVTVVPSGDDLRSLDEESRAILAEASEVMVLNGLGGDDIDWQLAVVKKGLELPGGGQLLFDPDRPRRLVAMYGHPVTSALGVLGEQSPEAGVERLKSIAAGYDADGATVVPTFEIIATVASASAGADGDYSSVTDPDVIRPWVETAAANDVYVVLDLQPGRSSFVQQVQKYEEFLKLPHVGLALDPEWRLKPNQVHLRQIGRVHADEVNQVIDWLAELVRRESLPQKLLILHQFRHSMITERERVETPPELAVLIHMDGQGGLGAKYNTWESLTSRPDAEKFYWGWKNFYDEDSPVATPDQVLALEPDVLFVSFQ